ncbi:peptidoglycan-binding protein [Micromonospora sp. CPCC 206060]|uniref:peptidoglycan-binding protein n=1 Tax=Micromonospora sp. CPCC 206060 TaxID=3122406 RepID=UPI002FF141DC
MSAPLGTDAGTAPVTGGDGTADPPARRRRWRPGTVLAAGAVVVLAGGGVAVGVAADGSAGESAGAAPPPPATTTVTRQTLVDRETKTGELGYGTPRALDSRDNGTLTWSAATGTTVTRGRALYRVDDTPVVLLYGSLPAYRPLRSGVSGRDVEQFERNLTELGYTGFTVDQDYTSATADAVRKWQEDLGVAETGQVEPGRIVYATGTVRVASQGAEVGDAVGPGRAVLSITGTARLVTCTLDVDDQRLVRKGAEVTITLPDGKRTTGRVGTVETVIQTSAGAAGQDPVTETKIEVSVTGDDPAALTGFEQAAVDVGFVAAERAAVLTVPVAALLALAEGGYGLQVVDDAGTRIVAVKTGLFAAGRVEVSGDAVVEGLTVGMPGD